MANEAARGNGVDVVASPDGSGAFCDQPSTQATDECSTKVFIEGNGVVRLGDAMSPHDQPGCSSHAPTLSNGSGKVFVEGRAVGRVGDFYGGNHEILTGSSKVIVG